MKLKRLAILGSTRGTYLPKLIAAIQHKVAVISAVISNKADALILQRAQEHQLPTFFVNPAQLTREQYDKMLSEKLCSLDIDLIVLIGYMRILSASFIHHWQNKIINVHPSLLPAFAGQMNLDVHQTVLAAGVKETGCTVHVVTEKVDAGPILIQKKCPVLATDTAESLKVRVQALEVDALVEVIYARCNG